MQKLYQNVDSGLIDSLNGWIKTSSKKQVETDISNGILQLVDPQDLLTEVIEAYNENPEVKSVTLPEVVGNPAADNNVILALVVEQREAK